MPLPSQLEEALRRLATALDQLDAAVARRAAADAGRADLAEELAIMQDDRGRLAIELDAALARLHRLETAHGEARARLAQAAAMLRETLGTGDDGKAA